jgi:hypothetical protein
LGLIVLGGLCLLGFAWTAAPRPGGSTPVHGLRAIQVAQSLYREGDKEGDGTQQFAPSLRALTNTGPSGQEDLIDEVLASGRKQGYVFAITSASRFGYTVNADPIRPGVTGDRHFGANMRGELFYSTTGPVRWNPDGTSPDSQLGR